MSPQTYTYSPRPYLANNDRFSTASGAPLSAIGNMLSSPYDTDDSDAEDTIRTPSDVSGAPSTPKARTNRGDRRLTQSRQVPPRYMRSVAGEVEVIAFHGEGQDPQARSPPRGKVDADGNKRITIIDFPSPSLSPSSPQSYTFPTQRTPEPPARMYNPMTSPQRRPPPGQTPAYPSPTRPGLRASPVVNHYPHSSSPARDYPTQPTQTRPQLHLLTQTATAHGLIPPSRQIPNLPPPNSPISPMLAAPPSSHPSPIPRFFGAAGGNRDSTASGVSTNESIAGFDTMKEKNALFRGGEEELMAFSPRIKRIGTGAGQGSRNTWMGERRTVMGGAGADFWKRFSVMGTEGLSSGKDSEWLSSHNSGWKSIKMWIIIGIVLLILAIGGGVTAGIMLS